MKRNYKHHEGIAGFNPSVNDCRLFLHLSSVGSLSGAARENGLTQPALTYRLGLLERDLGVKLWQRHGRSRGRLTPAGERFARFARVVIDETERLVRDVAAGACERLLVLAASTIPGEHLLPVVLEEFELACPDVTVRMSIMDSADVHRQVEEGLVDIGFCGVAPPEESSLMSVPIVRDEIVLAALPSWVAEHGESVSLSELSGEVIVRREAGSGTWSVLENAMRVNRLRFPSDVRFVEAGSTQAVVEAVRRGIGIGFVSRSALGDLQVVQVRELTPLNRFVFMIYQRNSSSDPVISEFMGVVRRHFSAY